jgi:serine/threonine protein kinase
MPLTAGSQLGSYQALTLVGAGGMGEVYHARDLKLGREVALKILRDELAQDAERLGRFEREARLLASLNHPHIATLYGMEEAEGVRFLIMEFVPGPTVADRLALGPLTVEESLSLGRQMAEALEAAHEKGVVHRDLKPGNVKITPAGKVKLLDFGLAKVVAAPSPPGAETATHEATREGMILGTPYYMSPEQVRGQSVDRRTDIWSFGCVLFEALSGRRAFPGSTGADIFASILEKEPNWTLLPAAVPPSIVSLLERCFRKDPGARLPYIGDARIELLEATDYAETPVEGASAGGPSPPTPRRLPPPWMALRTTANRASRLRVEDVQRSIFVTRLKDLRTLYRRTWLVWAVGGACALALGLAVGLILGMLILAPQLNPSSAWPAILGVLLGITAAVVAGFCLSRWWTGLLERRLRSLHKAHPRDIDQWGGEAMLSDRLAIEGLLEVIERESG